MCVSLLQCCFFPSCPVKPATCVSELAEFYRDSCRHHNAEPIESIMKHLDTLDLSSHTRRPILNLREQNLTADSCEALEEVLKRVSRNSLHINNSHMNWTTFESTRDKSDAFFCSMLCENSIRFENNGDCSLHICTLSRCSRMQLISNSTNAFTQRQSYVSCYPVSWSWI